MPTARHNDSRSGRAATAGKSPASRQATAVVSPIAAQSGAASGHFARKARTVDGLAKKTRSPGAKGSSGSSSGGVGFVRYRGRSRAVKPAAVRMSSGSRMRFSAPGSSTRAGAATRSAKAAANSTPSRTETPRSSAMPRRSISARVPSPRAPQRAPEFASRAASGDSAKATAAWGEVKSSQSHRPGSKSAGAGRVSWRIRGSTSVSIPAAASRARHDSQRSRVRVRTMRRGVVIPRPPGRLRRRRRGR